MKKIGGPSLRGNKSPAADARPLGPWLRKRPSAPQGEPVLCCTVGDAVVSLLTHFVSGGTIGMVPCS